MRGWNNWTARRPALYRVAQESLNNVARHAQASRVEVNIQKLPDCICMKIEDDGKSFNVERVLRANRGKRLGLLGMRERVEMVGGSFCVESVPGAKALPSKPGFHVATRARRAQSRRPSQPTPNLVFSSLNHPADISTRKISN